MNQGQRHSSKRVGARSQRHAGRLFVGTSGWSYKAWASTFYPRGLAAKRQFSYYATRFSTVEVNATFYRLPSERAIADWAAQAPPGFIYAVKGSRSVTHYRRLLPGARSFDLLLERVPGLGEHLGPVLWQLPPGFNKTPDHLARLEQFATRLPPYLRHALEFRDPSWLSEDVFDLLLRHRIANVSVSAGWFPRDLTVTTDFTYVRFHGLEGGAAHNYTRRELEPWAEHLRGCIRRGVDCFAYFNNDVSTRAPFNAETLCSMVEQSSAYRANASKPLA